ncbi:MAG TPA: cytochrome c biogenesis protein CcsA [Bacteroidota bacterium]
MDIGHLSILAAFLTSLGAAYSYFTAGGGRGRASGAGQLPRRLYWAMTFAVLIASGTLMAILLTHQFQYSYAARYSSQSLPLLYTISAFWAGQEGTFLLWALLVSLMGVFYMHGSGKNDATGMAVVSAFSGFLFLLMLVKSPFEISQQIPADGAGLNPLLQDPWMAIHPPILFIGYAAALFPFAMVVSALRRRRYEEWFESGFAWTLFAAGTLGAGIIIGGFWAYKVLGWGGYWGWDPVENSSLVPWLILLALIHGLVVQKTKGALVRTNMALALVSFILVLYATFLTRSGVLTDFSVHSFVDLGISNYLIGVQVAAVFVGLGLFASRFREIRSPGLEFSGVNRDLAMVVSIFVLCLGALFTFAGMSSPILTGLLGKASQVDTSFYNKVNLPVGIGIALLLGVTPFLGWSNEANASLLRRLSLPLALTVLSCCIAYVGGVTSALLLLFVGSASFGVISNAVVAFRQYKSGWMTLGGPVGHIGVGLLLIGIVGSGEFDERTQISLKAGEPQSVFGYQLTFQGASGNTAERQFMQIDVSDGRSSYRAAPRLYFSEYNQSLMREPDIKVYPLKDLYISPLEMRSPAAAPSHHPLYDITKGETKEIAGYRIKFSGFDMSQHGDAGSMAVGALLEIERGGKVAQVTPRLLFDPNGERKLIPADLPPADYRSMGASRPQVALSAISVEEKKVGLEILGIDEKPASAAPDELIVEVSTKPLMMVVWTGVILILAGTAMAFKRRLAPG